PPARGSFRRSYLSLGAKRRLHLIIVHFAHTVKCLAASRPPHGLRPRGSPIESPFQSAPRSAAPKRSAPKRSAPALQRRGPLRRGPLRRGAEGRAEEVRGAVRRGRTSSART